MTCSRFLWLAFFAAYAVVGLRNFKGAFNTPKVDGTGPFCSSDSLLKSALGVSDGSQKLLDVFAGIPARSPIVIFWPEANGNAVIFPQLAGYLAWPREIWSVPSNEENIEKASIYYDKVPHCCRIYYVLKPPAASPGSTTIGPMTILRVTDKKQ